MHEPIGRLSLFWAEAVCPWSCHLPHLKKTDDVALLHSMFFTSLSQLTHPRILNKICDIKKYAINIANSAVLLILDCVCLCVSPNIVSYLNGIISNGI